MATSSIFANIVLRSDAEVSALADAFEHPIRTNDDHGPCIELNPPSFQTVEAYLKSLREA